MFSEEWTMCKSWKVVLVVLPCLLAPLGCVPKEAFRYNNDVAGITRDLQATGKQYGEKLRSNLGNPAKSRQLYEETVRNAEPILKRGRALTPPNTTEGKALHKGATVLFGDRRANHPCRFRGGRSLCRPEQDVRAPADLRQSTKTRTGRKSSNSKRHNKRLPRPTTLFCCRVNQPVGHSASFQTLPKRPECPTSIRESQGLTLAEVAERMGIDAAALSRLETGKMLNPTIATLHKWAEAFGQKLDVGSFRPNDRRRFLAGNPGAFHGIAAQRGERGQRSFRSF